MVIASTKQNVYRSEVGGFSFSSVGASDAYFQVLFDVRTAK